VTFPFSPLRQLRHAIGHIQLDRVDYEGCFLLDTSCRGVEAARFRPLEGVGLSLTPTRRKQSASSDTLPLDDAIELETVGTLDLIEVDRHRAL